MTAGGSKRTRRRPSSIAPAGARRVPELLPALERDRGPDRSQAALSGLPAEHDRVLRGDPVLGQRHHEGRVPALRNGAVDSVPERRAPEVARHPEQALPRGSATTTTSVFPEKPGSSITATAVATGQS